MNRTAPRPRTPAMHKLALLLVVLLALGAGIAPAATPAPFSAEYALLRDGRDAGTLSMTLEAADPGHWLLRSDTRASGGMAGILGVKIREQTWWRLHEGAPELQRYRYLLDAGLKKRRRTIDVDWQAATVLAVDRGTEARYAAVAGMVDRHLLPLVLGQALRVTPVSGEVTLPVAGRRDVGEQHYRVLAAEAVDGPAGSVSATPVTRTDPGKSFTAWYAADVAPLPLRIVHGDYELRLRHYAPR